MKIRSNDRVSFEVMVLKLKVTFTVEAEVEMWKQAIE
jgi:hypothetical protein